MDDFPKTASSRRRFLADAAAGMAAALLAARCHGSEPLSPAVREHIRSELAGIRPREEVLAQAREGIERYRKNDVRLTLVNTGGAPLAGLVVEVVQEQSAFDWGHAGAGSMRGEQGAAGPSPRTADFARLFNCTTAKCYWDERWHQPIEHEEGKRGTERFLDEVLWASTNGIRVKGHPLVWTVDKAVPKWLLEYDYPTQLKKLEAHVRAMIRCGGKLVTRWELCNEMLWEPSLRHVPERNWPHIENIPEILTYLEPAMRWAREENPDAVYSLNDYGLELTYQERVTAPRQRKRYVELVTEMQRRGCSPDAIGTQTHIGGWYPPGLFRRVLDDLAQAGLPIQITEFSANPRAEPRLEGLPPRDIDAAVVRYLGDMYTVAFGHPKVNHFTYWGGGRGDLLSQAGAGSPAYQALYELIRRQWMTRATLTADSGGVIALRAFQGDYALRYRDRYQALRTARYRVVPAQSSETTIIIEGC
jgi:GH35 family endo-1,4-beta-xylanase